MIYLTIIIIASAIIGTMNGLFAFPSYGESVWNIVLCVSVSVVAAIVIDAVFATIIRWCLPEKWFGIDKRNFSAGKKERRFYERIGIKKWKDMVIELGCFTGFRKNRIAEPTDNLYVARYIKEANYGVAVHIACVFCGYLVCLIFPAHWYSVGIPVGFVNMVLNALPLMILRYNLPKLHSLYSINLRRAARTEQKEESKIKAFVA